MHGERSAIHWIGAVALLTLTVGGCATITGSQTQTISVETRASGGDVVEGATCKLNNDKGEWAVQTPGGVMITRSAADLFVRCQKEDQEPGSAVAVSRANAAIFGNVLLGGVIGAAIDHNQGTGYDYPSILAIEMGVHKTIDLEGGNAVTVSSRPSLPTDGGAASGEAASSTAGKSSVSIDELKDLLQSK